MDQIEIDKPKEKPEKVHNKEDREQRVVVFPHRKQSVPVKNYEEIAEDVKMMKRLIKHMNKHGYHGRFALSLAHCQIESENPKRFFVDSDMKVYINPVITEKSELTVSRETCLSFPFRDQKKIQRYFSITAEYYDEKMQKQTEKCKAVKSAIFQHEISHFDAKYIYDKQS